MPMSTTLPARGGVTLEPGWYPAEGGRQYWDGLNWFRWDGRQWLYWTGDAWVWADRFYPTTGAAGSPDRRRGRSRRASGALILVGGVLMALAMLLPWLEWKGPELGLSFGSLSFGGQLTMSDSEATQQVRILGYACAVTACLSGMALLWTRSRLLSVALRLVAVAAMALPAMMVWWFWSVVGSETPLTDLASVDTSTVQGFIAQRAEGGLSALGISDVAAGTGLFVWTAAVIVALIGSVLPGRRD